MAQLELEDTALVPITSRDVRKRPKGYWAANGETKRYVELGSGEQYWLSALWTAFCLLGRLQ